MTCEFLSHQVDVWRWFVRWMTVVLQDPSPRAVGSPTILRLARDLDGPGMWALASRCGLDVNSPYAYALWGLHHRKTTLVAEQDGVIVGFVLGYLIPTTARDLFIWQVAVAKHVRSEGLASLLLDTLCRSVRPSALEATVTESNGSSDALFRSFARRHDASVTTAACFDDRHLPEDHEAEWLYRIDLHSDDPRAAS